MLTNSKLAQATAAPNNVLNGKTFYAGDKILKTGNLASKAAETVTLNASTTSKTFDTSGKYCTGNMVVNTSTMAGSTVTLNASTTSKTFDTSGKLCTGNMTVSTTTKAAESVTLNASTTSKTFDTSGKLCTGNMVVNTSTMAGSTVTLNASTTSKTFSTSGKLCTGNMVVNTSTKGAESKTFTPSTSAQSYTFATSGKLCTGNMSVTVNGISVNSQLKYVGSFNANGNAGGTGCRTPEGGVETNMYSYENTWVKFTTQVYQSRVTVTTKLAGNYMIVGRNWGPQWWYGVSAGTVLVSELYSSGGAGGGRYNWEIFYYA